MRACFEYSLGEGKVEKDTVICNMPWRGVTRSVRGDDCGWDSCPHPGEEGVGGNGVLAVHECLRLKSQRGKPALHVQSVKTASVSLLATSLLFPVSPCPDYGPERAAALSPERRSSERKDEKELGV